MNNNATPQKGKKTARPADTDVLENGPGKRQFKSKLGELRRILVPIDFSKPSLAALQEAAALAQDAGAALYLLHVLDPIYASGKLETSPLRELKREARQNADRELDTLAESVRGGDFAVNAVVRIGTPGAEIVKMAEDEKIGLIVIASRGRTGLRRFMLGSTAERVARNAPCPVLIAR